MSFQKNLLKKYFNEKAFIKEELKMLFLFSLFTLKLLQSFIEVTLKYLIDCLFINKDGQMIFLIL